MSSSQIDDVFPTHFAAIECLGSLCVEEALSNDIFGKILHRDWDFGGKCRYDAGQASIIHERLGSFVQDA
jgi:hypothetical protein